MDDSAGAKQVMSTGRAGKPRFFYGYIIVIVSFLIVMMVYGSQFSFGVFFKPVLAEFGWSRAVTSGAYSLYMVLQGFWGIAAGRLTDRVGSRLVVTVSGIFLGLGYLLMSRIGAVWQLYLFYGVLASMGTGCWVALLSTVARWFIKRMGLMSGIIASGVGVDSLIMAPLANELIARYGWRDCYIIVGIAALVVTVGAAQFLRRGPGEVGQFADGAGGGAGFDGQEFDLGLLARLEFQFGGAHGGTPGTGRQNALAVIAKEQRIDEFRLASGKLRHKGDGQFVTPQPLHQGQKTLISFGVAKFGGLQPIPQRLNVLGEFGAPIAVRGKLLNEPHLSTLIHESWKTKKGRLL